MHYLNRFFLSLILTGFSIAGFAHGYKISIRVKGLQDTTCYLAYHFGDKQYLKDTAKVDSKGLFVFEGKEPLPGGIYLAVLPGKKYFEFIVNEQQFSLETDTLDYVKHMKVKGSEENTLFFNYLHYIQPRGIKVDSLSKDSTGNHKEEIEKLNKEVYTYREDVAAKNPKTFVATLFKAMTTQEPTKEEDEAAKAKGDSLYKVWRFNYYKGHFFDNINFSDDRIVRTPIYHQKIKEYITNLTVPHIDSINKAADWLVEKARGNKELFKYTVWWITTHHETSQLMGADAVYVHMVNKYYKTKQAFWVDTATLRKILDRTKILEPLLIGKVAPQLVMNDSTGKWVSLHKVPAKYTVVFFWDPNCGHCQKETPKLYEVYRKYKNNGVEVYAAVIDRDRKKWIDFIKKHNLTWINVWDPNYYVNFKNLYDIYSTPVMYVLNEKKEIIYKRIGVDQLDEILGNTFKAEKEKKATGGK